MNYYEKTLRWTCPHHKQGTMSLRSGIEHLRRKHYDCWSCRLEGLMLKAMCEGRGSLRFAGEFGPLDLSRA